MHAALAGNRTAGISRLLAEIARAPERPPAAGAERLRPGDVVGRFELLRELGRGGFGVVFEARDPERRRRVALKTVRCGAPRAHALAGLRREIEAGRLRHPGIVKVLGSGRCARGPFVVLERLRGETVAERLMRGPLPVEDALAVAAAVARALAYLHARGVLHRDVKPANVFLPSRGEAKLIDFGLAHGCSGGGPRGSGTSGYMAPEQRRGGREDARTDLYALGLLLHEMAAGSPLHRARGLGDRGAPSRRSAIVPPALARLVSDLVERDPARRPASADEVLRRLEEARSASAAGAARDGTQPEGRS
jgi:serine/threonine protein kinase